MAEAFIKFQAKDLLLMSMKIILTKDVDTLGDHGDVVTVADGFARNYLFPKNMAVLATAGAMADLDRRRDQLRRRAEKKHAEAQEKAEKVTALGQLVLEANAGEDGKLFGSVTTKELARILTEKTGLEIDRKTLLLDRPINRTGSYDLSVRFSTKVMASIEVMINAPEAEEPKAPPVVEKPASDDLEDWQLEE